MDSLRYVKDVMEGICRIEELSEQIKQGSAVLLRGSRVNIAVGRDTLVKVNTSIGISRPSDFEMEIEKLANLCEVPYRPDILMDLSVVNVSQPLYAEMIDKFGGPVGTLPHYLAYEIGSGIDERRLFNVIETQAKAGVSFMTLHVTPTRELFEKAQHTRAIPCTSRGGGLVIADLYLKGQKTNVFAKNFDDILAILKQYDVVLSLGAAFRPASIIDAFDEVHESELAIQNEFIQRAVDNKVQVIRECVGHMDLGLIPRYISRLQDTYDIPIMPLGPIPTDSAVGEDHIAAAIGSSHMALLGGAHILNSITREEHTGGIPGKDSVLEGLRAARIAAHCVNLARFGNKQTDEATYHSRSNFTTCVVNDGLFGSYKDYQHNPGCNRCGSFCPLVNNCK